MREKYESLGLADLKAIAKARGLRGTSVMKKAELVEIMLAEDERDKAEGKKVQPQSAQHENSESRTERPERKIEEARGEDEKFPAELDSGVSAKGILEVMPDGYGIIRSENYMPGEHDV